MNEFSLPNLTSEHIRWTPEYYTAKEFASYFRNRMPIVVKLTEGDDGTRSSSVGGERPGTITRIQKCENQRRVLAKDHNNRIISIPYDFPIKFTPMDLKHGELKQSKTIRDIIKKSKKFPIHGQFDDKFGTSFNVDGREFDLRHFGRIKLIKTYTETFLKGNYIINGELESRIISTPSNANVHVQIAFGLLRQLQLPNDNWDILLAKWLAASKHIQYHLTTGIDGIMIFSSKSDADFSLSGSDEQHTFHDERDVEHITNEVAIMKTTNNNTQHIIQSSNSRHHGTDVTNDNGELRDDDEVFIRAESAPHVSSQQQAVVKSSTAIRQIPNNVTVPININGNAQQHQRALSEEVFSPRPEPTNGDANFQYTTTTASTHRGDVVRRQGENNPGAEPIQLIIKNPYRNSSIQRHKEHLNYYNQVDISEQMRYMNNGQVPRSISDIVEPEALSVASDHEYLLRLHEQKQLQRQLNRHHTSQLAYSSSMPRQGQGTSHRVDPGFTSYTLPHKQHHSQHAGKVRYTQAYALAPTYSTLPNKHSSRNGKQFIYDEAYRQGYDAALNEKQYQEIYSKGGLQLGIQGGRNATTLPRRNQSQLVYQENYNQVAVNNSYESPLSSPNEHRIYTTHPDEKVIYQGQMTLTRSNKHHGSNLQEGIVEYGDQQQLTAGHLNQNNGSEHGEMFIGDAGTQGQTTHTEYQTSTHRESRNETNSHRLVPPTQQRAKKRSNQSEWATSKFIFDSDDGQSDIQRQHDNISRVYSIHNDEDTASSHSSYDDNNRAATPPRTTYTDTYPVQSLESSTGFKVASAAQNITHDQGRLPQGQGHYNQTTVTQVMQETYTSEDGAASVANPRAVSAEPLYASINRDNLVAQSPPQSPGQSFQFKVTATPSTTATNNETTVEPVYSTGVFHTTSNTQGTSEATHIEPAYATGTFYTEEHSSSTNSKSRTKSEQQAINDSLTNLDNAINGGDGVDGASVASSRHVNELHEATRTETTML